jgi:hypothetical protein
MKKSEVILMAESAVTSVIDKGNFFQVAEVIAAMSDFCEKVRKDQRFMEGIRAELQKYPKAKFTAASGAVLEAAETGTKYDYSQNPKWVELKNQEDEISEKRKEIEDILKTIPAGKVLVDEETGESLIGPAKTSTSSFKVTLAK